MRKRIATLVALVAVLALAGTAAAAITITQAPAGPGYQNLSPWNTPVCGGNGGNPYSLSDIRPIRLGFGWLANNGGSLKQFFQNSNGSVSITASAGTDTLSDSWASSKTGSPFVTQQGITWTSGEPTTGTPPGGGTVTGVSAWYRGVLLLAPGTYTLRVAIVLEDKVSDGWVSIPKGTSLDNGSGCTFTVVA